MPITCSNCHQVNRDTARFCRGCGASLSGPGRTSTPIPSPGSSSSTASSQTGRLPPNTLLAGRYLILQKIGQGGMAAVYQTRDVHLPGKFWAVKEMSDAAITDPAEKQRALSDFRREAQILASLDHPNIPKVIDSFSETGKHYLAMEYVDGETLEALLVTQGHPFNETEVRSWLEQLCSVLAYLHTRRPPIIFRDLKPGNIMLTPNGQIKLIDFGIVRLFQPGKVQDTTLLGTAGYASPEHHGHGQTDARSDIYSLGVTVHRLLSGHDPATTPFNLPPIRQLNPNVSQRMEQVIARATQRAPQDRWQSVSQIQSILRPGQSQPSPIAGPPTPGATLPARPAQQPSSRPTTRLIMTAAKLTGQQLTIGVGSLMILIVLGIWVLGPSIERNFPIIWNNVPSFAIAGLMAYAAARRHGAAMLAHFPITLVGWFTWWTRSGYTPSSYWPLVSGTLISGLTIEAGLYLLPHIRGKARDEAWKREIAWFGTLAIIATVTFYAIVDARSGLAHSLRLGIWIGAAGIGALAWFLGDLVQQWVYLRQTGMRRTTPP